MKSSIWKIPSDKTTRGREVEKTNLEKMCAEYYDVVFRYLLTLTRDYDLAEELTQETFPTTSIDECSVEIEDSQMPQPEEALIQGERKLALYKAIQRLPSPVRDVLMLRITGELSFKEIGEILGKSENWARVTFYRGKQIVMKEVPQHD